MTAAARILLILVFAFCPVAHLAAADAAHGQQAQPVAAHEGATARQTDDQHGAHADDSHAAATDHGHADEHHGNEPGNHLPAVWSVLPFVALLLCIAAGPLLVRHFWHHHYPKVAIGLGMMTAAYYVFGLGDTASLVHVGFEYFSFIALLTGLFVAAGGIVIDVDRRSTPMLNTGLLAIGAAIANVIGTTGAAMLLIRPFMRINQGRLAPFHIIFFIFIVANIGGALTPIGDPPLFLGFLRGIDFFLFFRLNFDEWLIAVSILLAMFYVLDHRHGPAKAGEGSACRPVVEPVVPSGRIAIRGGRNFVFLAVVIGAVFLDPNKLSFLPTLADVHHGEHYYIGIQSSVSQAIRADGFDPSDGGSVAYFSFVREIIQLVVGIAAFSLADKRNLEANGFNFEPIKEVAYLFIGIFLTMVPALALIRHQAVSGSLFGLPLGPSTFYFGTGALSGVLDNAPTFVSFLAGLEGKADMIARDISATIQAGILDPETAAGIAGSLREMAGILAAEGAPAADIALVETRAAALESEAGRLAYATDLRLELTASAVAAVFWGAMTYIGNGPNFMVKSIAENTFDEHGKHVVEVPSFFGYVVRYSLPILLPVLVVVWLVSFSPWRIL